MEFIPIDLISKYPFSYIDFYEKEIFVNKETWPKNLSLNPDLNLNDKNIEYFNQTFWSDSTLDFFIESALGRCRSLVSRALNGSKDKILEHSLIKVLFTEENPTDHVILMGAEGHGHPSWMTKSNVIIYFKDK